jgi:hypothetical protein
MYKQKIKKLSKQRDECFIFLDEKEERLDPAQEEKIDNLANQIVALIKEGKDKLPIDFIIEELTKLGWAPCILYDDNGCFAVSTDGYQTISEETSDTTYMAFVPAESWKDTIREALDYFLDKY